MKVFRSVVACDVFETRRAYCYDRRRLLFKNACSYFSQRRLQSFGIFLSNRSCQKLVCQTVWTVICRFRLYPQQWTFRFLSSIHISNETKLMHERLKRLGFVEHQIVPDGNCQFRAVAHQLFGDENRHPEVRQEVVKWLSVNANFKIDDNTKLLDFIDLEEHKNWETYVRCLSKEGFWGDHLTLIAASEVYKIEITIVSSLSTRDNGDLVNIIKPRSGNATRTVYLSHWHEYHFNSLQKINERHRRRIHT
jgi:hypothetical protein